MKKIVIALLSVLILALSVLVVAAFAAQRIIAKVQPELEAQLSQSLGAKVSLGSIRLGFFPNPSLSTSGFSVGSAGPKVGRFLASVAVLPLFSKKVAIREITIESPSITLIKSASGTTIEGFAAAVPTAESRRAKRDARDVVPHPKPASESLPIIVELRSLSVRDGVITLVDQLAGRRISATKFQLRSQLSLTGDLLTISELAGGLNLNDAPLQFDLRGKFSPQLVELTQARLRAFGGTAVISATGELNKSISSSVTLKNIDLPSMLAVLKPELAKNLTGSLAEFSADMTTNFSSAEATLSGDGAFLVSKGGIKGVNLVAPAVRALERAVPVASKGSGGEGNMLSPAEQAALDSTDTTFDLLKGAFTASDHSILLTSCSLTNALVDLTAKGSISAKTYLNLQSSLLLSPRLSAMLAARNSTLKKVFNENKRIEVPILVRGVPSELTVVPDVRKIAEHALKAELADKVDRALGKALGSREFSGKDFKF